MPKQITFPLPDRNTTEEQINKVIPIIELMKQSYRKLSGFGGDCWAAAYAFNEVVFEGEGQVVAAFNKQMYLQAQNPIGHVAVHYLTDEVGEDFVDMEGFKAAELIDSWGMLAPDDDNYIEIFNENGIEIKDESFDEVIWVSYTMQELRQQIDSDVLNSYVNAMKDCLSKITTVQLEAPVENTNTKMKMK